MKTLIKMAAEYSKYCEALKEEVYYSGENNSTRWFNKANIKQIMELLSKDFVRYAKYNDITFLYREVEKEIRNSADHDWKEILNTKSGYTDEHSYYVLLDLIMEYHDGLQNGVRRHFHEVANKIFRFDNDNDNDDNDNDNDNDDNDD